MAGQTTRRKAPWVHSKKMWNWNWNWSVPWSSGRNVFHRLPTWTEILLACKTFALKNRGSWIKWVFYLSLCFCPRHSLKQRSTRSSRVCVCVGATIGDQMAAPQGKLWLWVRTEGLKAQQMHRPRRKQRAAKWTPARAKSLQLNGNALTQRRVIIMGQWKCEMAS